MEPELQYLIEKYWRNRNHQSSLISQMTEGIDDRQIVKNGYIGVITFSPIKRIGDLAYVGYDLHVAPFGSHGGLFKLEKKNGKWIKKEIVIQWVS
ncbi:hypothetical protein EDS67_19835 [candidate division KSB1 bacterium]|nr:MAG: hypothetical protein EDS67_19835 [candidate division KSB1 bacterium]MBC6950423.1 hypothetical protein [candidate division KSB1 bacterium]MCE7945055.1 hypothetical protein [Chlorobi bacterium CHB1]